jgi:hypothetical protein
MEDSPSIDSRWPELAVAGLLLAVAMCCAAIRVLIGPRAQDRVLAAPAGLRINAVALRIDSARPLAAAGTDLPLTGFATDLVGTRLRVRGQSVEAGEARITGGTLAALRADQLLRVRGLLQDGLLRAREVIAESLAAREREAAGS